VPTIAPEAPHRFYIEKVAPDSPTRPLGKSIRPEKRKAPRNHLGHPYFSKLPWNVVSAYIEYYTQAGDLVVDPFCGSGVVAMEALAQRRRVVALDTNPLACFITNTKIRGSTDLNLLDATLEDLDALVGDTIRAIYDGRKSPAWVARELRCVDTPHAKIPERWRSDALSAVEQLFTPRQLLALSLLRDAIADIRDQRVRQCFRLLLSYTVCRSNRMYFLPKKKRAEQENRKYSVWEGDSTPFYNKSYQVRGDSYELNVWENLAKRYRSLRKCLEDASARLNCYADPQTFRCLCKPAQDLEELVGPGEAAYALLDPPYGARIPALDLSAMWLAWLGLRVPARCREAELLDDPSHGYCHEDYIAQFEAAVSAVAGTLRPKGWCTLVFAHDSPQLWDEIIAVFTGHGLQFRNSIYQPVSLRPFSKTTRGTKKFSGLMMVNFRKERAGATRVMVDDLPTLTVENFLFAEASNVIAAYLGATTSEITTHLRSRVFSKELQGSGGSSKVNELLSTPQLEQWLSREFRKSSYHRQGVRRWWFLNPRRKYDLQIDSRDRIRYYVFEALRSQPADYDDICASVLGRLGADPTPQGTVGIRDCLGEIAYEEDGLWHLSPRRLTQYRLLIGSPYSLGQVREIYQREKLPLEFPSTRRMGVEALEGRFHENGVGDEGPTFYRTLEILVGAIRDMAMAFAIQRIDVVGHFAQGAPPYDEVDLVVVVGGDVCSHYQFQKAIAERVTADIFLNHNVVITVRASSAPTGGEVRDAGGESGGLATTPRITVFEGQGR